MLPTGHQQSWDYPDAIPGYCDDQEHAAHTRNRTRYAHHGLVGDSIKGLRTPESADRASGKAIPPAAS